MCCVSEGADQGACYCHGGWRERVGGVKFCTPPLLEHEPGGSLDSAGA